MIFLEKVSKQFDEIAALRNVDLTIAENTIFGLLGPNGAGKTTLIRIITSIFAPDNGKFFYNGKLVNNDFKPSIGYLPEERGLYKKMKVGEQLLYLAQLKGLSLSEAKLNLQYWLEKLSLTDREFQKVEQLSKGLQQKVQFIATVIHNPDIIILDEPFTGFDPINAQMIKNEIVELQKKGKTIIISSHRMESVEELCDEIALLNKGEIILSGKIADIKKSYSKNSFLIKGIGEVKGLKSAEIHQKTTQENSTELELKIKENQSVNSLLQELISLDFQIQFVEEILPSMHDIFIENIN